MPRPCRLRMIAAEPPAAIFKPAGVPARELQWIWLALDEFEALRLADLLGLDQEQAALQMGISRPTLGRLLDRARRKTAQMLAEGCALLIEGGPVQLTAAAAGWGCGRGGRQRRGQRRFNSSMEETMETLIQPQAGRRIVAVPSTAPGGLEAKLGQHFGRCECFTLVEVVDGQAGPATVLHNLSTSGCTGVLDLLRFQQVNAVLARNIGPRPLAACQMAGMPVYRARGVTVGAAIANWLAGTAEEFTQAASCAGPAEARGTQAQAGAGRCGQRRGAQP